MNKYYYWIRIDKETRSLLISKDNPMEFENKEQAIKHYYLCTNMIGRKIVPIEIDEHIDNEPCIDTIFISPAAQLIRDGNQHKMF